MSDIWFYCGECERWYYASPGSTTVCPMCGSEPLASQDRAAPGAPRATAPLAGSAQS